MIDVIRRLVVGGDASGDRGRGHSIRERRSRRAVAVEMLEGRMLLSGIPHSIPGHLTPPTLVQPPLSIQQQAAVDFFATLDSIRGSGTVTPVEIANVQKDISLIFGTASPSRPTVITFLNDYQAATVGHTLNPSSVPSLQGDLTTMIGSAYVSTDQFHRFLKSYPASIGANSQVVAINPSFIDVKTIMA
jgi:hypothetical protein